MGPRPYHPLLPLEMDTGETATCPTTSPSSSATSDTVNFALAPQETIAMTIRIRNESPSDVAAIEATTVAAFLNGPHTSHTEQFIINALRKSEKLSGAALFAASG
jgi:hypothetical protein